MGRLDDRILNGAVHAVHLAVDPRMAGFGEPVVDAVLGRRIFERVGRERLALFVACRISAAPEQALPGEVTCVGLPAGTMSVTGLVGARRKSRATRRLKRFHGIEP